MKTTNQKKGKAQTSAANENPTHNISYVVRCTVLHFDENRKGSTLMDKETHFKNDRPIINRAKAFLYVHETLNLIQGGTYNGIEIASPVEGIMAGMKNINTFSIDIDCINHSTVERITISEGDLDEPSSEYCENCSTEYSWYGELGYQVDDFATEIEDECEGATTILDYTVQFALDIRDELNIDLEEIMEEYFSDKRSTFDKEEIKIFDEMQMYYSDFELNKNMEYLWPSWIKEDDDEFKRHLEDEETDNHTINKILKARHDFAKWCDEKSMLPEIIILAA